MKFIKSKLNKNKDQIKIFRDRFREFQLEF